VKKKVFKEENCKIKYCWEFFLVGNFFFLRSNCQVKNLIHLLAAAAASTCLNAKHSQRTDGRQRNLFKKKIQLQNNEQNNNSNQIKNILETRPKKYLKVAKWIQTTWLTLADSLNTSFRLQERKKFLFNKITFQRNSYFLC
jgi:hypothetical protein